MNITTYVHTLVMTLTLVSCFFLSWYSFASFSNQDWIYPTPQVSQQSCKNLTRADHSPECKKDLPIISLAQYDMFINESNYRQTYSVLRWATYNQRRDQWFGSHPWVDIATAEGTPVLAIRQGTVVKAWWHWWRGNVVTIKHQRNGMIIHSTYAHLHTIFVAVGQEVSLWDLIGEVGTTWRSTGNHLHFQIEQNEHSEHPYYYDSCYVAYNTDPFSLVNSGLCRIDMINNTLDPIRFLETQWAIIQQRPLFVWRDQTRIDPHESYRFSTTTAPQNILTRYNNEYLIPHLTQDGFLQETIFFESSNTNILSVFPQSINTRDDTTSMTLLPTGVGTARITIRTAQKTLDTIDFIVTAKEAFATPTEFKRFDIPRNDITMTVIVALDDNGKPLLQQPWRWYYSFDRTDTSPCIVTDLRTRLHQKTCQPQYHAQHHYSYKDSVWGILILNRRDDTEEK